MTLARMALSLTVMAVLQAGGARPAAAQAGLERLRQTTPQERARAQTMFMRSKLGLTPEQASKVEAINLKYAQQMDPLIKGDEGGLVRTRRMREINGEKEGELKKVLSPPQFDKYVASRDEMRDKLEAGIDERSGHDAGGDD